MSGNIKFVKHCFWKEFRRVRTYLQPKLYSYGCLKDKHIDVYFIQELVVYFTACDISKKTKLSCLHVNVDNFHAFYEIIAAL